MRRTFAFACIAVPLAAAAACATAQNESAPSSPNEVTPIPQSDAETNVGDAAAPSEDGGGDADTPVEAKCSGAGWCTTTLPDHDLTLKDIWPFEKRAFAIAESPTLGIKILEWDDVSDAWRYVDDNTQNGYGSGKYAGKLWAASENEVYYTVAPGFVYRGTRPSPPSPWSWTRDVLANNSHDTNPGRDPAIARYTFGGDQKEPNEYVALGVWGAASGDVYAWYGNTIFHHQGDAWVAEHIVDDSANVADTFYILGGTGSGADDVWFAGARGQYDATGGLFACPIVIHKTPAGYEHVVDNTINQASDRFNRYNNICAPKAGARQFTFSFAYPPYGIFTRPWTQSGLVTNVASAGPNRAVGLMGRNGGDIFTYLTSEDGGAARVNTVPLTVPRGDLRTYLSSVWADGKSAWFSGWGLVIRSDDGPEVWSNGLGLLRPEDKVADAATYTTSTVSLNGAFLDRPLHQVRGTSNTNLWVIGAGYALHKTTP